MDIRKMIENLGEKKEEVLRKAVQCKNVEELMALAEENGIGLTAEDAAKLFTVISLEASELTEDELDTAAGGTDTDKGLCWRCLQPFEYCYCSKPIR